MLGSVRPACAAPTPAPLAQSGTTPEESERRSRERCASEVNKVSVLCSSMEISGKWAHGNTLH